MSLRAFFFLLFLVHNVLWSQNKFNVSGFVEDAETGERLINAYIFNSKSQKGTVSNNYGFYSISLNEGDSVVLIISYVSYQPQKISFVLNENKSYNIKLTSLSTLDEVLVTAEKPIEKRNEMSVVSIPIKQIEMLPTLGGESDILKAIQLMPGVQSGNEGSTGLYVRGGSPDQNLVLLDDVPLYYVSHLGGLVSTFNTDAINSVKLIKGGFPARYGSRLSSVLDIRMKEGNFKKFQGKAMIGMLATKISVEGPIKKDTTSYIISFRRFMYDLLTRPISKIAFENASLGYHFYDFNAKINHRISDKDRLFFSFYTGDDRVLVKIKENSANEKYKTTSALAWGNRLGALRWNHIYNSKLFSNATLTYTRYRFTTEFTNEVTDKTTNKTTLLFNSFNSGISDWNAKIDFDYFISSNVKLTFGGNSIYHIFTPGVQSVKQKGNSVSDVDTTFGDFSLAAWERAAFVESEITFSNRLSANIGLREALYSVNDTNFFSLEPRALLNFLATESLSIKASYTKMQQSVHLLSSSGVGLPTDLWLPATAKVRPSTSIQYALGIAQSIQNGLYELSIETFYKKMNNLIEYKAGADIFTSTSDWQNAVEKNGIGLSYGAEFLLQKKQGNNTGWIGYTLSKTTRQFENLNRGKPFNYRYDRRHDISIVYLRKINENIDFSATWVFGTGNAFTLAIARYNVLSENGVYENIHVYDGINTFRMRPYH
ncbi:MAG: carboxypeptidase-like regulatory domain-containing protein, partial [Bacteroidia bacterium]